MTDEREDFEEAGPPSRGSRHAGAKRANAPTPQDPAFADWLAKLWVRKELPERIRVYPINRQIPPVRGESVYDEGLKPNEKLTPEQVVKLSNEILAEAQDDCDKLGKPTLYLVEIIDRNRNATNPLTKKIELKPVRIVAERGSASKADDEDDLTPKSVNERYLAAGMKQIVTVTEQLHTAMGHMLTMYKEENVELRNQNRGLIEMLQDSLDRKSTRNEDAEDRKQSRKWNDLYFNLAELFLKDGAKTVQRMLPGAIAGLIGGSTDGEAERILIEKIITDLEEKNQVVAFFGEYDNETQACTKPGILTLDQARILVNVKEGKIPADALDALDPALGQQHAISEQQIHALMGASAPDSVKMGVMELIAIRRKRREAAEKKNGQNGQSGGSK